MALRRFITEYHHQEDFWKDNPELLALDAFKELYERDTSEGHKDSAEVVRAIYFVYDHYCTYSGLPRDMRIELCEKEYLKKPGSFRAKLKGLQIYIDLYQVLQKDSPRLILDDFQEQIAAKLKFMKEARESKSVSIEDWEKLDKMSLTYSKLIDEYKKLEASVEENEAIKRQGDVQLSLLADSTLQIRKRDPEVIN